MYTVGIAWIWSDMGSENQGVPVVYIVSYYDVSMGNDLNSSWCNPVPFPSFQSALSSDWHTSGITKSDIG
jgi:hypothetical protein